MKIHEFQAKETLKKYGVPVQDGVAIKELSEFDEAIAKLQSQGINQFVVKSQIHAGGRGKGKLYNPQNRNELILEGGVKFTTSVEKAKEYASKMLGNLLVTHQTGAEGKIVKTLFITEGLDYKKELYLGILLDRAVSKCDYGFYRRRR
jgi:succinyl-CoA synthetase beta subunit